jgi:translation initiation factor 1
MDLKDQLKKLFPDHTPEDPGPEAEKPEVWMQDAPILCKYEKRHGKPVTVLEGYTGAAADFATLSRKLKRELGVGGSFKNDQIIIQGDYRDRIMEFLKGMGFSVKRVGG